MTQKRTTVVLDPKDAETLTRLAQRMECSEMEAMRRAIRLTEKLVTFKGRVMLERGRKRQQVVFL